jgi:hypothetical protein
MKRLILSIIAILIISSINAQPRKYRDGSTVEDPAQLFLLVKELIKEPTIFKTALIKTVGDDYKVLTPDQLLEEIKKSNKILDAYAQKVDAFVASKPKESYYIYEAKGAGNKSTVTNMIKKIEKEINVEKSAAMVYNLQELYIKKCYAENMLKIYPNDEKLKSNLTEMKTALDKFGTPEAFMAKMKTNQAKYIANLKMDAKAVQDKVLEQFIKTKFELQKMDGLSYTVSQVNITKSTWIIEKNEWDIPTHKWTSACIAIKTNDAKCGIATTMVRKDYAGGGTYGEQYLYMPNSITIIPCENLK